MSDVDLVATPVDKGFPAARIKVGRSNRPSKASAAARELQALVSYLRQQEAAIRDRFGQLPYV